MEPWERLPSLPRLFSQSLFLGLSRQHGQSAVGDDNVAWLNDALLCVSLSTTTQQQGRATTSKRAVSVIYLLQQLIARRQLNSFFADSLGLISACSILTWMPGYPLGLSLIPQIPSIGAGPLGN